MSKLKKEVGVKGMGPRYIVHHPKETGAGTYMEARASKKKKRILSKKD